MISHQLPLALAGWQLGAAAVLVLILLIVGFIIISFFSIWLKALLAGAPVGFPMLVAMAILPCVLSI